MPPTEAIHSSWMELLDRIQGFTLLQETDEINVESVVIRVDLHIQPYKQAMI